MAEFLGFGQLIRPDIGLIADGVQNLSEIYTSDQPDALRNIRLNPEILDIIYRLSDTVSKEDLRAVSGLSSLLLPTLHLQSETLRRIKDLLYLGERYINSSKPIGIDSNPSLRGDLVKVPNIIIYNGSIQCQGVQYRTKILGESSLYSGAENVLASVSISRSSLFNSEKYGDNEQNTGYFKYSSYPLSIRVRRRSHVNRITVNKSTFVPRVSIKEDPSHEILCYVDNGNTGNSLPLKLLSTKNSPLRIPCRMASGTIKFTFTEAGVFFFGYQVQPLQSRVIGEQPQFLALDPISQTTASSSFTLDIDITTTGYQNSYDLYLYLYINPEKIRSIEFSGINISEFVDGRDIGLTGFNNLTSLTLRDTSIKILPIWLKTLSTKLQTLDIASDGDTYRNGVLEYFDYRNASESPSSSTPLYTTVSYLTIPKKGSIVNENGNDWNDIIFEKYITSQVPTGTDVNDPSIVTRIPGTDFRVFSAIRTLNIGDRMRGFNPRLDDVFPNLSFLRWGGLTNTISGTLPKINNHGRVIQSYNINSSGAGGDIADIGTSQVVTDNNVNGPTHISKYKIDLLDIGTCASITGQIATADFAEWETWFSQTKFIDISRTSTSIGLQPTGYVWQNLQTLNTEYSGGIVFTPANGTIADPIKAPGIPLLNIYGTASTGPIPSLGTDPTQHTSAIVSVQFGGTNTISTVSENGYAYILPSNFAPDRPSSPHKLSTFEISDTSRIGRYRANDFKYLYELDNFNLIRSTGMWGKFPIFPTKRNPEIEVKEIFINISGGCRFYDLSTLDITSTNRYIARDLVSLDAQDQNIDRGGCKLPLLEGTGGVDASKIQYINLSNSLSSIYPSNWVGTDKLPNSYVFDTDIYSLIDGITPGRQINSDDAIYFMTGISDFNRRVLVNDSVHSSVSGAELARVVSVESSIIYLDRDILDSIPGTYYFKRNTQPIDNWFQAGFTDLTQIRLSGCRLSGSINIRSGFSKVTDDNYSCFDLSNNCLTGYIAGFDKIFSGSNRKITLDLSYNNFSVDVIRDMLSELLTIEAQRKFTNVEIRLNNTKISSSNTYINYTQEELFPTTLRTASSQVTSLTRIERVKIYSEVTTVNEDGTETTNRVVTGSRDIRVPGEFIPSLNGYYRTQTNERQQVIENDLGSRFKNNFFWRFNLGFTYQSLNTVPDVTSTTYSNPTTREESLAELGYTLDDLA